MFAGTDVLDLFPSSVWLHEIENCNPLNADLLVAVKELQATGHGYNRTDGGGWVSKTDLNERDAFAPLTAYMISAAEGVLHFL